MALSMCCQMEYEACDIIVSRPYHMLTLQDIKLECRDHNTGGDYKVLPLAVSKEQRGVTTYYQYNLSNVFTSCLPTLPSNEIKSVKMLFLRENQS